MGHKKTTPPHENTNKKQKKKQKKKGGAKPPATDRTVSPNKGEKWQIEWETPRVAMGNVGTTLP
ncbi:hypothetical protein, partial [Vibrio vulnificus]|uniref:hypothetical protein n=1 Tax=Vibrio vulnificus TaxID=672 RepID=UPI001F1D1BCE